MTDENTLDGARRSQAKTAKVLAMIEELIGPRYQQRLAA